jgi:hypothetical protein
MNRLSPGFSGGPVFSKKGYVGIMADGSTRRKELPFHMSKGRVTMTGEGAPGECHINVSGPASIEGVATIGLTSGRLVSAEAVQACMLRAENQIRLPTLNSCGDQHFNNYGTKLGVHQGPTGN